MVQMHCWRATQKIISALYAASMPLQTGIPVAHPHYASLHLTIKAQVLKYWRQLSEIVAWL
jgi:hypothetical protein